MPPVLAFCFFLERRGNIINIGAGYMVLDHFIKDITHATLESNIADIGYREKCGLRQHQQCKNFVFIVHIISLVFSSYIIVQ